MKPLKTFFGKIKPLAAVATAIAKAREADRYMRIMFEYTPLSASLWDEDCNIIDYNLEAARMFGLALSKHLAVLLNGKIWAESEYG